MYQKMFISFTLRYVNIDADDYEDAIQSDFDIDLVVFACIRPMLGDGDMNRLEAVTYNGDTVHPETTLADLGMVDGGSYHLDVHFPVADENSDDDSDRVLPSPDTDTSVSDWEGWDASAQLPAEEAGQDREAELQLALAQYHAHGDLGLDEDEVY